MDEYFGLELNPNLTLIIFDDQQKARIGAALQNLADQIDGQVICKYNAEENSGVEDDIMMSELELKNETVTNSRVECPSTSLIRNEIGAVVKNEISNNSNQELIGTTSNLSAFITLTKEEPQLQEFEIELPASDEDEFIESDSEDGEADKSFEREMESIVNNKGFVHYICPECGLDCGSYTKWKFHTEKQHTIAWLSYITITNVDGTSCYHCLVCNKVLSRKLKFRLLQEHHIKHLLHNNYLKCGFCDKRFPTLSNIYRHINEKHSILDRPYCKKKHENMKYFKIFCPICQQSQSNIKHWQEHLLNKHDYVNKVKALTTQLDKNMYSCQLCQKKMDWNTLKIHMLIHEPNKSFQCILCKKYETHVNTAVRHMSIKHIRNYQDKLFTCSYCRAKFAKKSLLINHHTNFHNNEISEYTVDFKDSSSSNQLQLRTTNDDTAIYNAPTKEESQLKIDDTISTCSEDLSDDNELMICNEKYDKDMADSIESDSPDNSQNDKQESVSVDYNSFIHYSCPVCGDDCGSRTKWKLHTENEHIYNTISSMNFRSITTVRNKSCYQCLNCNKMFSHKTSFGLLQEHHIKHLPHKFYLKCSICEKKFKLRSDIYKHLKKDHAKLTLLDLKKKPSNPSMKYIKIFCPFCQKPQSNVGNWRKHLSEKHDYVNKAESQATLINHYMHSCQLCQRNVRKDHIQSHMLTHEPHKSFQCTLCKKYETQLSTAVQHMSRYHYNTLFGITKNLKRQKVKSSN